MTDKNIDVYVGPDLQNWKKKNMISLEKLTLAFLLINSR